MSHTPGPLHVGFHWRGHGYGDFAVMTESGAIVAEIKSGLRDDAQLYAGAPALLEACEAGQKGCGGLLWLANNMNKYGTVEFKGFLRAAIHDARLGYDAARAAIAKTKEATA